MPRLRIDLAYDGGGFAGWAAQPGQRTVEGELSAALATILRAPDPIRLTVAGRTDAGVHARGQVAHVDVAPEAFASLPGRSARVPEQAAGERLNAVLPADIVVRSVSVAPPGFDARFAPLWRRYRYRLCDNPAAFDPLRRHDTVVLKSPLDVTSMNAAARLLVGLNDFAAFCKRREGASTIRELLAYDWSRDDDGIVVGTVRADAFCHSMVRALVGALVPVGTGRVGIDFPARVLRAGVRDPRVKVMAPHGLSLEEVRYPADAELMARATLTRSVRAPVDR
ncbi:tRNA pseudouridine(38-40) synthase TruA [Nostocoides sp.]|uniref:tRNA pseudouridine(38-40) synthase TruA n=2 Tax=Nostocoides sp. TaxID=1917966 RepID=UPI003BB14F82